MTERRPGAVRVALYARVSTVDKNQNPETQLLPLREFARSQEGWTVAGEFVDQASATALKKRVSWTDLLDQAAKRRVDVILVWRLDRSFRSVADAASTLGRLRAWGVGLRSYTEPWIDTTTPFGEALYYITVAFAGLERGILAERVKAGMERARREGRSMGRPRAAERAKVAGKAPQILGRYAAGEITLRTAAKELGVGPATVIRMRDGLRSQGGDPKGSTSGTPQNPASDAG